MPETVLCGYTQNIVAVSITCRLDQQIAALDQLQAVLDEAPKTKMPCPGMAAAQQASRPDMLTYMASSRFGPALLSSLAEQVGSQAAPGFRQPRRHFSLDVHRYLCIWNASTQDPCTQDRGPRAVPDKML